MNWQQIATAPKDGTRILGWSQDDDQAIIQWSCKRWDVVHDWESYAWSDYYPTHWMPLPEPPKESDA